MRRVISLIVILVIVPTLLLAAPRVTAISMNPVTAPAGTPVTISVTIQNQGTTPYGCPGDTYGGVTVYVYKGPSSADLVFHTFQPTAPLAPGEVRTVTMTTQWTIPAADVARYTIAAWSPLCGSEEIPNTASVHLSRTCAYTAPVTLVPTNPAIKLPRRRP